jgi:hypothetical protein
VFTEEDRERIRDKVLAMARKDRRVTAAAIIGGAARGRVDRWSDVDLTFGVTDIDGVMVDWTRELTGEPNATHLFDLSIAASRYRVFLFPGNLQVDLSFTPENEFGALGPGFQVLFGEAVTRPSLPSPSPRHMAGMAVHHAVRARICVERERVWQAEYWISALRDETLALACRNRGLEAAYGRGLDRLPEAVLDQARSVLVRSLDADELIRALDAGVELLLAEAGEPATGLASSLRELGQRTPSSTSTTS